MTSIAKLAGRRDIEDRSCTMQDADGNFCAAPSHRLISQPVCFEHALEIYRDITSLLDTFVRDEYAMLDLGLRYGALAAAA